MSFESWENRKFSEANPDICECETCEECHDRHREFNEPHLGKRPCAYCLDDGYCHLCQTFKDDCEEWYHPIREAMIKAARQFKDRENVAEWLERNKWMESIKNKGGVNCESSESAV